MVWCVWVIRMRNRSNNKEDYKTRLKKNRRSRLEERKKKSVCFFGLFFFVFDETSCFLGQREAIGSLTKSYFVFFCIGCSFRQNYVFVRAPKFDVSLMFAKTRKRSNVDNNVDNNADGEFA